MYSIVLISGTWIQFKTFYGLSQTFDMDETISATAEDAGSLGGQEACLLPKPNTIFSVINKGLIKKNQSRSTGDYFPN